MKKSLLVLGIMTAGITAALVACNSDTQGVSTSVEITPDSLVRRGEYLITSMGCDDCHTSKKMGPRGPELDLENRFGGHLASTPIGKADPAIFKDGWVLFNMSQTATFGPWGMSFAANISSDDTGIGSWTEEQFFKALREGKYKGLDNSRPLLPPMPWESFKGLSDLDIKAMFAYLKSTKPVVNVVPAFRPITEFQK